MQEVGADDRHRARVGGQVVAEDLLNLGVDGARAAALVAGAEPLRLGLVGDLLKQLHLVGKAGIALDRPRDALLVFGPRQVVWELRQRPDAAAARTASAAATASGAPDQFG